MCQIWHANFKANRSYQPDTKTRQKPYKNFEVKGQCRIKFMNVHDTFSHLIDACAKYGKPMSNIKNCYGPNTKTCQKPCKFDLEVKGQHCIGIMNLRNTSSHGYTPIAKYGKPYVSDQKKVMCRTQIYIRTDCF